MAEIGTFLTSALGWAGEIIEFSFTTEPIKYFVYLALIAAVIGITKKVKHA